MENRLLNEPQHESKKIVVSEKENFQKKSTQNYEDKNPVEKDKNLQQNQNSQTHRSHIIQSMLKPKANSVV